MFLIWDLPKKRISSGGKMELFKQPFLNLFVMSNFVIHYVPLQSVIYLTNLGSEHEHLLSLVCSSIGKAFPSTNIIQVDFFHIDLQNNILKYNILKITRSNLIPEFIIYKIKILEENDQQLIAGNHNQPLLGSLFKTIQRFVQAIPISITRLYKFLTMKITEKNKMRGTQINFITWFGVIMSITQTQDGPKRHKINKKLSKVHIILKLVLSLKRSINKNNFAIVHIESTSHENSPMVIRGMQKIGFVNIIFFDLFCIFTCHCINVVLLLHVALRVIFFYMNFTNIIHSNIGREISMWYDVAGQSKKGFSIHG
ncbi:hypothetical protein SADUNF_Sadunf04G0126400 [Salix dunnii]|uniref:Uncharacterized protein n=1 Tax=Salix dunnii TaxID=1413687 RepID=A0A835N414_9ROSI|nr:hypothetical protein SADUNF_Sadunf04G0126400 [Salix dunnii]